MTHLSRILEHLEDIAPAGNCDDCLSEALRIRPRQTVNLICRPLGEAGRIIRDRIVCPACGSIKLVNRHRTGTGFAPPTVATPPRPANASTSPGKPQQVNIEEARTAVVRLALAVWRRHFTEDPPRGAAALFVQLRNEAVLPTHIANMMHTISALRNVHVYEELSLDANAMTIAAAAIATINEWAKAQGFSTDFPS